MKVYEIIYHFKNDKESNLKPDVPVIEVFDIVKSFIQNKVLGENNSYHGEVASPYSLSKLLSSKVIMNSDRTVISYVTGCVLKLRTPSLDVFIDFLPKSHDAIGQYIQGSLVLDDVTKNTLDINTDNAIVSSNPIFLGDSSKKGEVPDHFTYKKHGLKTTSDIMKRILRSKAKRIGIDLDINSYNIEFILDDKSNTKPITFKGKKKICNIADIKITGGSDIVAMCYGFGLGLSSSCGFGFVFDKK